MTTLTYTFPFAETTHVDLAHETGFLGSFPRTDEFPENFNFNLKSNDGLITLQFEGVTNYADAEYQPSSYILSDQEAVGKYNGVTTSMTIVITQKPFSELELDKHFIYYDFVLGGELEHNGEKFKVFLLCSED